LEVCGAKMMTYLGMWGKLPSLRHPIIFRKRIASKRKMFLKMGTANIVYCMGPVASLAVTDGVIKANISQMQLPVNT